MPDVQEGLEHESVEHDVNTDSGFTARLAEKVGRPVTPEQFTALQGSDRSVAAGLEVTEESQSRDERGRFTPAAKPVEEEEVAPPAEEGDQVDPWASVPAELREEYEALKKEREGAQSVIGRQGQELGELRQQMARLEGRLEALPTTAPQMSQPVPLVDDQTVSALENMLESHGGRGMMSWVIDNRPDLIDTAIEVWGADDPVQAAHFAGRWGAINASLELEQQRKDQVQPQADPWVEQQKEQAAFNAAMDQVASSAEWREVGAYVPDLSSDEVSPLLKRSIADPREPWERVEALKELFKLAQGRALAAATEEAGKQRQQEVIETKKQAQVATGSLKPAAERQPEANEDQRAEAIKRFKASILAAETTSVRDGLTYGSAL